jgi:SAM-dependent MidA family methyltransferase
MAANATELERRLIEQIWRDGPLTFRDFMQAALYNPDLGYYNTHRQKIGAEGDYYTSSNVHAAFGAVLANALLDMWVSESGADSNNLEIIEFGPGSGQLAHDIISALGSEHPTTVGKLRYVLVETSPVLRSVQHEKLIDFKDRVRWSSLDELTSNPIKGIVVSNEFIDALPVHRARLRNNSVQELYVTTREDQGEVHLAPLWSYPSSRRLTEYLERLGIPQQDDQIVEICVDALDWLEQISRLLTGGLLVTIDYGDRVKDLYTPDRKSGTLRCFHRHELSDRPFDRVGDQDITSSVNFTALIEYGQDHGFEFVSLERQTSFLIRYGLIDRIVAEHASVESVHDLTRRLAIKNLFVPGGVSDSFRVLIQRR